MKDNKMLQAILDRIALMDKKMDGSFKQVNERLDKHEKRLDMIGSAVAYLEDDAPTRKEHNKLGKRVTKLEHQVSSN